MDKNNGCTAGCGSFLVLGGAFILTFIGMLEGTAPVNRNEDAATALFAIALVLVGIAILMARKAKIT